MAYGLTDGLDPSQKDAVVSEAQPLAILAGAGSGKTRVLTRRIAHRCLTGTADARHVLAITFTRKAASELDTRLRGFGLRDLPAAGTFHAVAYAQLRTRWANDRTTPPTLLDRKGRLLGRVLGGTTRVSTSDLATEIEWAKARLVTPDGYELAAAQADRRLTVAPDRVAEWYRRYEEEKKRRGLVDFDDLLAHTAQALETDPSFAAAQRWRFRHLFVDEYQDVNPLQERLLRAWLGDRSDLCVVGDPNQAIYGWNGADPQHLLRFAERHPGAEVLELRDSYRSTPQILATAAAVLAGGGDRVTALRAHRTDGAPPVVTGYATDADEANGVARAVHDHHVPGRPWSAQAVLVRTNAQASLFEAAFRRAAIPYRVRGATALLDDPEVRGLLRQWDRDREPLSVTLADQGARLATERAELEQRTDDASDDELAPVSLESSAVGRRILALEQVVRLGHDLLVNDPTARTDALGGWLRAVLHDDGPARSDAVDIVSLHAAKGLEWPVVHLTGMEAGLIPITHARTPEARAEERRLLYVAVTRAGDVLRCSWAAQRTFGTSEVARKPSPWLGDIVGAVAEEARVQAPGSPTTGLAAARAALTGGDHEHLGLDLFASTAGDDGGAGPHTLRTDLRSWRAALARAADVVPTVVLSDVALEAIAHHRPHAIDELLALDGIGPLAADTHGEALLAIVARHPGADLHPLASAPLSSAR
jgi:DNA helicase-2/ATP-dependent DNA helicase PcrA